MTGLERGDLPLTVAGIAFRLHPLALVVLAVVLARHVVYRPSAGGGQ